MHRLWTKKKELVAQLIFLSTVQQAPSNFICAYLYLFLIFFCPLCFVSVDHKTVFDIYMTALDVDDLQVLCTGLANLDSALLGKKLYTPNVWAIKPSSPSVVGTTTIST